MGAVIHLPTDVPRFRAGMAAVRARARGLGCTAEARRRALQTLLDEMQAGRSSGAAVALANSTLLPWRTSARGGAA